MFLIGFIASMVDQSGFKNRDLLDSENDIELFIERYKSKNVELKRVRIVNQLAGRHTTYKPIPLDAPDPVYSNYVSIAEYLRVVEIGRFKDTVLFSTGYNQEDKERLRELINRLSVYRESNLSESV